jgi:4-hydroxy-4-methyl-2-oxoglutarate aldolase
MVMLQERRIYTVNAMPEQISSEERDQLLMLDTGTIGHYLEAGFMDGGMLPRLEGARMAGTAVTVRITVPDSVMAHYILKFTRPGDILVIDRGQDQRTCNWGGATIHAAAKTGLTGVIVDGAVNDVSDARAVNLPMWSRSISPVTTKYRGLGGEMNVPVSCGGVAVNPGDAILADENGIVVIPRAQLADALTGGRAWLDAEQAFMRRLAAEPDLCYPDVTGASEIVEGRLWTGAA